MYNTISGDTSFRDWVKEFKRVYAEYGFWTAWSWHVWNVTRGSGPVMFGVYPYSEHWFVQYTIRPLYRLLIARQQAFYWFQYRYVRKHMYNTVFTDLKPGCYDKDTVMLHACFTLLTDFVEKESGGEDKFERFTKDLADETKHGQQEGYYNPPEMMMGQHNRQSEILTLYRWWKYQKPAEQKRRDELLHSIYGENPVNEGMQERRDDFRALEAKMEDDEQAMLHRLIDIRRSLWA